MQEEITCRICGEPFYISIKARFTDVCQDCIETERPDTKEEREGER